MPEDLADIEKEERRCEEMVSRELADALGINVETFNVFVSLFGGIHRRVNVLQIEPHQYVHMGLAVRMIADLRTIKILVCKGHTPQAAVVASTLFEESLNMRYIGLDNCRAEEWLRHNDEKHLVWRVSYLLDELKKKTGDDLAPDWTKLCQIKHYNPLLGPNFHVKVEHEKIKFHPGPHFESE